MHAPCRAQGFLSTMKPSTGLPIQVPKEAANCAAQDTKFHTSIGRGIFDAIFNPPKINVSEQFLPRRTAFVYELEIDGFNSDIPTTLRRSKADCPPVRDCSASCLWDSRCHRI